MTIRTEGRGVVEARSVGEGAGQPTRRRTAFGPATALMHRPEAGALIGALGVLVFFAVTGGASFLSAAGTASWADVAAELGIVATPVALLMIAGELDLSVGSVIGSTSTVVAIAGTHFHTGIVLAIGLAIALGLTTGL